MAYPRRHSPALRALGRLALRLLGWRIEGSYPELTRSVAIVAPHTSNWDFPVGVAAMLALDLRATYLAKHTIFAGPFGWFFRALGGIPVDRTAQTGMVQSVAARLRAADGMALGIAPEGTRKHVADWKTGFHRIARAAEVPIVPVIFDYSRRVVRFETPVVAGPDLEADLRRLQRLYRPEMARHPAQFGSPLAKM